MKPILRRFIGEPFIAPYFKAYFHLVYSGSACISKKPFLSLVSLARHLWQDWFGLRMAWHQIVTSCRTVFQSVPSSQAAQKGGLSGRPEGLKQPDLANIWQPTATQYCPTCTSTASSIFLHPNSNCTLLQRESKQLENSRSRTETPQQKQAAVNTGICKCVCARYRGTQQT